MVRELAYALFAVVAPDPERAELQRRTVFDVPLLSCVFGVVQLFVGFTLALNNFMAYFRGPGQAMFLDLLEKEGLGGGFERKLGLMWSGLPIGLLWLVRPTTWLLLYILLMGLARMWAFAIGRQSLGEIPVWAGLRLFQGFARSQKASAERARFGAERPDRLLHEPDCDLVVLANRPKATWTDTATISIGDNFYRLASVEQRKTAEGWFYAYRLVEDNPSAVIRNLVHYRPP